MKSGCTQLGNPLSIMQLLISLKITCKRLPNNYSVNKFQSHGFKKVSSADLLTHPGILLSSGTPEGGGSLTEGVFF